MTEAIMNMQFLRRGTAARPAAHLKVRSSLVRRLVQAQDDPGKHRIRAWLKNLDDEQLSTLGLTSDDIAVLRGTQTPSSSDASETAANQADTIEGPVSSHNRIDDRGLTPDQRQRVMQHVTRHSQVARAQHDLGDAGLRTLHAAGGGGVAVIRALSKAIIAAAGKWLRPARMAGDPRHSEQE